MSGDHFGYPEIKDGEFDGHFVTFDENNGGLDSLNLVKDWRLQNGVCGIGRSDEVGGCSEVGYAVVDEGYGVVDKEYFVVGGGLWVIFWAVGASYKSLTLYFYAYHWTCFVSSDG